VFQAKRKAQKEVHRRGGGGEHGEQLLSILARVGNIRKAVEAKVGKGP
jgi:hypothetical protein